jgi:hypothetical protein
VTLFPGAVKRFIKRDWNDGEAHTGGDGGIVGTFVFGGFIERMIEPFNSLIEPLNPFERSVVQCDDH